MTPEELELDQKYGRLAAEIGHCAYQIEFFKKQMQAHLIQCDELAIQKKTLKENLRKKLMYNQYEIAEEFLIPQTVDDFDDLVKEIVNRYKFSEDKTTHVVAIVAAEIQRLPHNECMISIEKLGTCIFKSIGYSIALHKSRQASHRVQIDNIAALLKENPYDQQALDALETASKEGSEYATEILSVYRPVDAGDNVVQINPLAADEIKGSRLQ